MFRNICRVIFFAPLIFSGVVSAETPAAEEPQLFELKKFEGSELLEKVRSKGLGMLKIRVSKEPGKAGSDPINIEFEGLVSRYLYKVQGSSSYEVFRNYEEELKRSGFSILREDRKVSGFLPVINVCNQAPLICGERLSDLGSGNEHKQVQDHNYLAAQQGDGADAITVSVRTVELIDKSPKKSNSELLVTFATGKKAQLASGDIIVFVDVVQPKTLTKKMVKETAGFIEESINRTGKVDLYGIFFDFDKTDIKPESAETITQIAEVLKKNPELKLKIVGHTDSKGADDYNLKLSEGRAKAVVNSLVTAYGIQAERLQSEGKGAKQPVADNSTDEGRAKNRRVELSKF